MGRTYQVGYGKPPKPTQFKKGQSGNPSGARKRDRSITALLDAAMNAKVTVTVDGRREQMSKMQAIITQLCNKAASGDAKATKMLLDLVLATASQRRDDVNPSPDQVRALNAAIMAALKARLELPGEDINTQGEGNPEGAVARDANTAKKNVG
jgi:hypothetical protein